MITIGATGESLILFDLHVSQIKVLHRILNLKHCMVCVGRIKFESII